MSNPLRFEAAGAIHHVVNRGPRKAAMFFDDADRRFFLRRLGVVCQRHEWRCLTYCLMHNHIHLVVETGAPTLGVGMRDLCSVHARRLNALHGHSGATVEARYRSRLVMSDEYLAQLLRYVALNPVKAALVSTPEAWLWSGHAALAGRSADPTVDVVRVGELLEPWGGEAPGRYLRLFAPDGTLAQRFGDRHPDEAGPTLERLLNGKDQRAGARAARAHGFSLAEIATVFGVSRTAVWRWTKAA